METSELTPLQTQAIRAIKALRQLTQKTGTKTTFTQNRILQRLSPEDLEAVALELEN